MENDKDALLNLLAKIRESETSLKAELLIVQEKRLRNKDKVLVKVFRD